MIKKGQQENSIITSVDIRSKQNVDFWLEIGNRYRNILSNLI